MTVLSSVLQAVGMVVLVVAGMLISVTVGLAVCGALMVFAGAMLERDADV